MLRCVIDTAVRQWSTRHACIKVKVGYFEHSLS